MTDCNGCFTGLTAHSSECELARLREELVSQRSYQAELTNRNSLLADQLSAVTRERDEARRVAERHSENYLEAIRDWGADIELDSQVCDELRAQLLAAEARAGSAERRLEELKARLGEGNT